MGISCRGDYSKYVLLRFSLNVIFLGDPINFPDLHASMMLPHRVGLAKAIFSSVMSFLSVECIKRMEVQYKINLQNTEPLKYDKMCFAFRNPGFNWHRNE